MYIDDDSYVQDPRAPMPSLCERACVCVCTTSSRTSAVREYLGSSGYVFWTVLLVGDVTHINRHGRSLALGSGSACFHGRVYQRSEDPDWEMMGFCPQGKVLTVAIVVVVVVGGRRRRLEQFGTPVAKVKRVARAVLVVAGPWIRGVRGEGRVRCNVVTATHLLLLVFQHGKVSKVLPVGCAFIECQEIKDPAPGLLQGRFAIEMGAEDLRPSFMY